MATIAINYWAIIVLAIVSIVLGFLWYGPLFGKQWVALAGIKVPEGKPCMKDMAKPVIISLIGAIIMAYCLTFSMVFAQTFMQATWSAGFGVQAGFWNWLGFVVPVQLSFVAWEGKSWKLFCIHAGYWLVLLGIMGAVLAVW